MALQLRLAVGCPHSLLASQGSNPMVLLPILASCYCATWKATDDGSSTASLLMTKEIQMAFPASSSSLVLGHFDCCAHRGHLGSNPASKNNPKPIYYRIHTCTETQKHTHRSHTDTQYTDTNMQRHKHTDTHTDTKIYIETDTQRHKHTHSYTKTCTHRNTETHTHTKAQKYTHTNIQKYTDYTEKYTDVQRYTHT